MPVSRILFVSAVSLGLFLISGVPSSGQILDASPNQQESDATKTNEPESAADTEPTASGILPAAWSSLQIPKVELPKMSLPEMPSLWTSDEENPSSKPSIFAPLASGTRKLSEGSKKTWAETKHWFASRGQDLQTSNSTQASSRQEPSFWKRMFAPKKEPVGPQTVGEWMSQERIDH